MRTAAAFFAGTTLIATIAAVHFWGQLRAGNRQVAALQQQVQQFGATPVAGALPVVELVRQPASADARWPVPETAPAATAPDGPPLPAVDCEAQRAQIRSMLVNRNADLVTELRLTAEETGRLLDIQAAKVAIPLQCTPGSPVEAGESLNAQLLAVLGPVRYEHLQEYNTAKSTRQNIDILRSQLVTADAPLDAEQERRLTTTIMDENRRMRAMAGNAGPPAEPHARLAYEEQALRLTEDKFERILAEAEGYLRAAQIAQLKGNMTRQVAVTREGVSRLRKSVEAGRGIPPEGPALLMVLPSP